MSQVSKFRIVTYNVQKCIGLHRRLDHVRIVSALKGINADIVALQEVFCAHGRNNEEWQAHFIARVLCFNYCMGHNLELRGGVYVHGDKDLILEPGAQMTARVASPRR
jgi:endonuclease/exonuclease/phosphatase family metal-dependent hydrolase